MSIYIKIKTLQSGQPAPYADHEYVNILTFTRDDGRMEDWLRSRNLPLIVPYYVEKTIAFTIACLFCPFKEPGDEDFDWWSPHLVSFDRLDPTPPPATILVTEDTSDRWHIHVRARFTD